MVRLLEASSRGFPGLRARLLLSLCCYAFLAIFLLRQVESGTLTCKEHRRVVSAGTASNLHLLAQKHVVLVTEDISQVLPRESRLVVFVGDHRGRPPLMVQARELCTWCGPPASL
jgi:hypothetical protein